MDSFIRIHNNTFSSEFCERIISMFESSPDKHEGKTSAGTVQPIKRSWDLHYDITKNPEWAEIDARLHECSAHFVGRYFKEFERHFHTVTSQFSDTGFCVRRYDAIEGGFDEHVDVGGLGTSDRVLAVMWYLNDIEIGGGTEFIQQGITINPQAGRLAIFPANFTHLHRGVPSKDKPKYIVNTFITYAGM